MKAANFKREHFRNGRGFSQEDFHGYIQASENLIKSMYTKYLPCVAGGILLSFLFSKGMGGFVGNILAVLCIFSGLIAGGIFSMQASKAVKAYAARLGITKADVAQARQHIKNGTVAWQCDATASAEAATGADRMETPACMEAICLEPQPIEAPALPVLSENPGRAVWAAGFMVAAWLLLLVLQSIFGPQTTFNGHALFFSAAALLGAGVYMLARPARRIKCIGAGAGAVFVLLYTLSIAVSQNQRIYVQKVTLGALFGFLSLPFPRLFAWVFFSAALTLLLSWRVSLLSKTGGEKRRMRLCALCAAGVYLVCSLIRVGLNTRMVFPRMDFPSLFSTFSGSFFDAICLFLVCMAVYALCNMPVDRVKLCGLGLVWAWFATAGMAVSLIAAISAGTNRSSMITYTAQFILAISGLGGYILLLCKRRVGLYAILLGVGIMLGAQFCTALTGVLYGADRYVLPLVSYALGALNPFFAYLAVRAVSKDAVGASSTAVVKHKTSAFQKAAAVLCLAGCIIGILVPMVTMLNGAEFVGGMAIYMAIGITFGVLGGVLLLRQRSTQKAYGKGMRVLGCFAFGFSAAFLLLSIVGIVVNTLLR
ncbi:MAG: hypothetical protein VB049_12335 [Candidatus Pelethousia sp.]|nr:hypothetical protein [Candidatus Pelethousia sp.]